MPPKPGAKSIAVNVHVHREELSARMLAHYTDAHPQNITVGEISVDGTPTGIGIGQSAGIGVMGTMETLEIGDGKAEESGLWATTPRGSA